jgi:3-hydroxymyristoyl/3-hydroxydecanoyl-(acyl carrier protein) dehydratase
MELRHLANVIPPEAIATFERACVEPLAVPPAGALRFDRAAVEGLLPHRHPFLFIDRVLSAGDQGVIAECDVDRFVDIFAAHFPAAPRWPGLLQVEAITQAGLLGELARPHVEPRSDLALTHVHAARFMREVAPGGPIQIVARSFIDACFVVVVGQVLRHSLPHSAAIASCLW